MPKILTTLFFVTLMAFPLTACGEEEGGSAKAEQTSSASEKAIKVASAETSANSRATPKVNIPKSNVQVSDIGNKICSALQPLSAYDGNETYKKLVDGTDDWVFRTYSDFKNKLALNSAGRMRFERLNAAFEKEGIELVVALLPTRGMMHAHKLPESMLPPGFTAQKNFTEYNKLANQLRNVGVSVATVTPEDAPENFYYKRDHHWSPEGSKAMAKQVAKEIKALDSYNKIAKQSFKTEISGQETQTGSFARFINEKCGSSIPAEKVPAFKTAAIGAGDDLFGDTAAADIVLIGTSNSTQSASKANFDGFLKEYIGADVENRAISGGGADTSFYQWLMSDAYKAKKPKVVIWEVPVYQDFDSGPFFRQLLPIAAGKCTGREIAKQTIPVDTNVSLLTDSLAKIGTGKGYYVDMQFSDLSARKMRVSTVYEDKSRDSIGLRRSKYYEKDGSFLFELNQEKEVPVTALNLVLPKLTGTIDVSLCKYEQ